MAGSGDNLLKIQVFAKVNLALRILGRLVGGYHSLETIFQNISLYDLLTVRTTPGKIIVHCDDPSVPTDKENTAWRAAALCLKRLGIRDRGVEIKIEKGIPTRSGLGGGSTDAAGTIIACEKLFGPLPGGDSTRFALAASIGAMLRLPVKMRSSLLLVIPQ